MESYDVESIYKNILFRGFGAEAVREIIRDFPISFRAYQRNETITAQGDDVRSIGMILEGKAICSKYHYDGEVQILQILERGETVGLEAISSSFSTSPYTVSADDLCVIAFFPYIKFLESDSVAAKLKVDMLKNAVNMMADDNIKKDYKIDVLSKRTLRGRIITYLSIICEKKKSDEVNIGMTQEQFANYLCVNRSVLSNELNKMRREGIIAFDGKNYSLLAK